MGTDLLIIQSRIHSVRGQQVILDRDLAEIYGVETRVLNQAVKRNAYRFPSDFMFQLTDAEMEIWKSQIVMTNSVKMGVRRKFYAFTESGVAMLSSVLNSQTAIRINMGIMRAFVAMRQILLSPPENKVDKLQNEIRELRQYVEDVFSDYNDINEDTRMQIELINQALAELQVKDRLPRQYPRIGFIKSE